MRIVYADETLAKTKAEEAVNSQMGVMTASTDGAFRKVADHNPWERFMPNWSDARISADLVCYMNGFNDPRRPIYYNKSTFAATSNAVSYTHLVFFLQQSHPESCQSWLQSYHYRVDSGCI